MIRSLQCVKRKICFLSFVVLSILSSCNSENGIQDSMRLDAGGESQTPISPNLPEAANLPNLGAAGPAPQPSTTASGSPKSTVVGQSCESLDPNRICLALKYVVYKDSYDHPTVDESDAIKVVQTINQVWDQCRIRFQIEKFVQVRPADYNLIYQTSEYYELDEIRKAFSDNKTLLVATTGIWNRSGGLGNTGANAWTAMPGGAPYGVVLEKPVGTYANLIGHEIGHYLNLNHVTDESDLMNPIIYQGSTELYSSQCETARYAAKYYWGKMIR